MLSVADWGSGMSAGCNAGLIVHRCGQWMMHRGIISSYQSAATSASSGIPSERWHKIFGPCHKHTRNSNSNARNENHKTARSEWV